jgi:hypothetical protein
MNWNEKPNNANWLQLGYVASNSASVLVPMSEGVRLELSPSDRSQIRQAIAFFDAAVAGLGSFQDPSLLFHTRATSFPHPAGALQIALAAYSSMRGGPVSNPEAFKRDLSSYKSVLTDILQGVEPTVAAIEQVVRFLEALIERAKGELQTAARHSH